MLVSKIVLIVVALSFSHSVLSTLEQSPQIPASQEKTLTLDPNPYLLPNKHPLRSILNSILSNKTVLRNEQTLAFAGFTSDHVAHSNSGIIIVEHPKLPGYLVKLYLESTSCTRHGTSPQDTLIRRCIGAAHIRTLINMYHMKCMVVPNKWLYEVSSSNGERQFILLVSRLPVQDLAASKLAWKTVVTKRHLKELFPILKAGWGSASLPNNVPYIGDGKFAFIDTEYAPRLFHLEHIGSYYLSPEMKQIWNQILRNNGYLF